jgi:hypothetical protein
MTKNNKTKIIKNLISISFLVFFTVQVNAQINNKTNLSELNQDQLKLALKTSLENMLVGQILIGVGIGMVCTGGVLIDNGQNKNDIGPSPETVTGLYLLGGGFLFELIGIPTFIIGSNRKTKIEIELAKFNLKGSASIKWHRIKNKVLRCSGMLSYSSI